MKKTTIATVGTFPLLLFLIGCASNPGPPEILGKGPDSTAITLPKEFANVWYRSGDRGVSIRAYSALGKLVVAKDRIIFVADNETLEIGLAEIKKVSWGTMPGDNVNDWAMVQYGNPEKVAGFKDGSQRGWGKETGAIHSTLQLVLQGESPPLNLIPMYGHPNVEKPAALKKADDAFIKAVVGPGRSREEVSRGFAGEGWKYLSNGDTANAMRRFNQSWLLNPNNYQSYWGFGALLLTQRKPAEAATHFEKALSLINEDSEKPRLLSDASRAYSAQGAFATDKVIAGEFFGKANSLLDEATRLDPQYGNAYRNWARSLYLEGNYPKAWDMVRQSRGLAGEDLSPDFIEMLSRKMLEPK